MTNLFSSDKKSSLFISPLITFIFLTISVVAYAAEIERPDLRFSGFATLGLSKSDSDTLGARDTIAQDGVYDDWSLSTYSKIGLQLDYTFSDRFEAGLQLIAKRRDSVDSSGVGISVAYLDYLLSPSLSLRFGRMAESNYMVSEYRNVGHAQLWAHTPMEFYGFQSSEYKDGIQLRHSHPMRGGFLFTRFTLSTAKSGLVKNNDEDKFKFDPNIDISVEWENHTWQLRFNHNRGRNSHHSTDIVNIQNILRNAAALGWDSIAPYINDFDLNDRWLDYTALGIGYQNNGWTIQSELNYADSNSELFSKTRGGYLLVGKRVKAVTPFIIISKAKNTLFKLPNAPLPFSVLRDAVQDIVNSTGINQKTLGLGFRWDISSSLALKTQWDRTWVDTNGANLFDFQEQPNASETVDQFTMTLDVVF